MRTGWQGRIGAARKNEMLWQALKVNAESCLAHRAALKPLNLQHQRIGRPLQREQVPAPQCGLEVRGCERVTTAQTQPPERIKGDTKVAVSAGDREHRLPVVIDSPRLNQHRQTGIAKLQPTQARNMRPGSGHDRLSLNGNFLRQHLRHRVARDTVRLTALRSAAEAKQVDTGSARRIAAEV